MSTDPPTREHNETWNPSASSDPPGNRTDKTWDVDLLALSAACASKTTRANPVDDSQCALLGAVVAKGPHGFSIKDLAENCGDHLAKIVVTLNVDDPAMSFWQGAARQCENVPLTFATEEQTLPAEKGVELLLTPVDGGFEFYAIGRVFDSKAPARTDAGIATVQILKCGAVFGTVIRTADQFSVVWPELEGWK